MEQLAKDLKEIKRNNQAFIAIQGDDPSTDDLLDGELSLEEHLLAQKYPDLYELRVNGIRVIHVQDGSVDVRYKWENGRLVNVKPGRF